MQAVSPSLIPKKCNQRTKFPVVSLEDNTCLFHGKTNAPICQLFNLFLTLSTTASEARDFRKLQDNTLFFAPSLQKSCCCMDGNLNSAVPTTAATCSRCSSAFPGWLWASTAGLLVVSSWSSDLAAAVLPL